MQAAAVVVPLIDPGGQYVPVVQEQKPLQPLLMLTAPVEDPYTPTGQGNAAADAAGQYVPALHTTCCAAPPPQKNPAAHDTEDALQDTAAYAAKYLPGAHEHGTRCVAAPAQEYPGVHCAHVDDAVVAFALQYEPGVQLQGAGTAALPAQNDPRGQPAHAKADVLPPTQYFPDEHVQAEHVDCPVDDVYRPAEHATALAVLPLQKLPSGHVVHAVFDAAPDTQYAPPAQVHGPLHVATPMPAVAE